MAKNKGKPENLIPASKRSKAEATELGRKGGIKSGEVRKEKRLMSMIIADWIAKDHEVVVRNDKGEALDKSTMSTDELIDYSLTNVLLRADSASVSSIKSMAEITEGSKVSMTAEITSLSAEQRKKRIKELEKIKNATK